MDDFALSINEFLEFRKFKILPDKGSVSKKQAEDKAVIEYEEFNKSQFIESDFDKEVKKLLGKGGEDSEQA
ncbi:hypothetical protein SDC9_198416 [bioreactor metagenome]|uniref:Virulence protein n=1 Tax=bioreactor metagenome TaxID=1076179 RepID=A0A645IUG1_9ZZZZ